MKDFFASRAEGVLTTDFERLAAPSMVKGKRAEIFQSYR
jgi:hypothetical protein